MSGFVQDDLRTTLDALKSDLLLGQTVLSSAENDVCAHLTSVFPHYSGTSLAAIVTLQSRVLEANTEELVESCMNFILDADLSIQTGFLLPAGSANDLFDFDFGDEKSRSAAGNTAGVDYKSRVSALPAPSKSAADTRSSTVQYHGDADSYQSCSAGKDAAASDNSTTLTQSSSSSSVGSLSLSRSSSLLLSCSDHKSLPSDRKSETAVTVSDFLLAGCSNSSLTFSEHSSVLSSSSSASGRRSETKDCKSTSSLASSSCSSESVPEKSLSTLHADGGSESLGKSVSVLQGDDSVDQRGDNSIDQRVDSIDQRERTEQPPESKRTSSSGDSDRLLADTSGSSNCGVSPGRSSSLLLSSDSEHLSDDVVQPPGSKQNTGEGVSRPSQDCDSEVRVEKRVEESKNESEDFDDSLLDPLSRTAPSTLSRRGCSETKLVKKDRSAPLDIDESSGDTLPDVDFLLARTDSRLQAEKSQADQEASLTSRTNRPQSRNSVLSDDSDLPDLDFLRVPAAEKQKDSPSEDDSNSHSSTVDFELNVGAEETVEAPPEETVETPPQTFSFSAPVSQQREAKGAKNKMLDKDSGQRVPKKGSGYRGKGKALLKKSSLKQEESNLLAPEFSEVDDPVLPSIGAPKHKYDSVLSSPKLSPSSQKAYSSPMLSSAGFLGSPKLSHLEVKNSLKTSPLSPRVASSGMITYLGRSGSGTSSLGSKWNQSSSVANSTHMSGKTITLSHSSTVSTTGPSEASASVGGGEVIGTQLGIYGGTTSQLSTSNPSSNTSKVSSVLTAPPDPAAFVTVSNTAKVVPRLGFGPPRVYTSSEQNSRSTDSVLGDISKPATCVISATSCGISLPYPTMAGSADGRSSSTGGYTVRQLLEEQVAARRQNPQVQVQQLPGFGPRGPPLSHPALRHGAPQSLRPALRCLSSSAPLIQPARTFASTMPASGGRSATVHLNPFGPNAPSTLSRGGCVGYSWVNSAPALPPMLSAVNLSASSVKARSQAVSSIHAPARTNAPSTATSVSSSQSKPATTATNNRSITGTKNRTSTAAAAANSRPSTAAAAANRPGMATATAAHSNAAAGGSASKDGEKRPVLRKAVFEPPPRPATGPGPSNAGVKTDMGQGEPASSGSKRGGTDAGPRVVEDIMPMDVDETIILDDSQGDVQIVASTPSKAIVIDDNRPGPSSSAAQPHVALVTTAATSAAATTMATAVAGSSAGTAGGPGPSEARAGTGLAARHPGIDIGVRSVLEVFPDASPQYIQDLLEGYLVANGLDYALTRTMDCLLDNPGFPRRKPGEADIIEVPDETQGATAAQPVTVVQVVKPSASVDTKDYFKDWDYPVDGLYYQQALDRLSMDFPWLNRNNICNVMSQYRQHYAPTYQVLEEAMTDWKAECAKQKTAQDAKANGSKTPSRVKRPDVVIVLCHKGEAREKKFNLSVMKKARDRLPQGRELPKEYTKELQAEVDFIARQYQESDRQMAWSLLETEYEEQGQMIECNCCFAEHPFENLVQCFDGHLFCCQCLVGYAKEAIYGSGKLNLPCMAEGCDTGFPKSQLFKALPPDMMEKYDERVAEESLNLAAMPDLVRCPKCSIPAVLDPGVKVLRCPNADCRKETCRDCKEDWSEHVGKTCEQVEKKDETKLRTEYEEKMTQARVRTCPKCKAQFFKEEGCNKMTCRCGTTMCYICRQPQISYKHFCQHPRDPGKGCDKCTACSLWTNPEEDEKRAIQEMQREAQLKRREQGFTDDKVIGVPETEGPPAKKRKT